MRKRSRIAAVLLVLCLLAGCNNEPAVAIVPDVIEADRVVAVAALAEQGFIPVVKETIDQTAAVGTVVSTDPPAGSAVAVGGKVYLFVAADTGTTTAMSTTEASHAPTSTSPATTTTQTIATERTSTTTTATTTVADWCAAGHRFSEGICGVCGKPDPDFVPTLSLGQTWMVEGQWSLTILGVTEHNLCNPSHHTDGQRVITIRYVYENLGFVSDFEQLQLDSATFTVTDENGRTIAIYPCLHKQGALPCPVGENRTAEETYAVDATCRRITLLVTFYAPAQHGVQRVQFDIPLP